MPMNGLGFVSDFAKYPLDTHWPPDDPRYGESTEHLLASGDWDTTVAIGLTCKDGLVNFNNHAVGAAGAPSLLGVADTDASGNVVYGANAWTFTGDFSLTWPAGGPGNFEVLSVYGEHDTPGSSNTLAVYLTRAGFFFSDGQTISHEESTGVTYHGGSLSVHVEVDPHALWFVQVFAGGALAATFCGLHWGGGLLGGAHFGEGAGSGGSAPTAVLTTMSCGGVVTTRMGPATCPHDLVVGAGRTQVFWVP